MLRSANTWTRLINRLGVIGLFGGMTSLAVWYGCAGSNTDYVPVIPAEQADLFVPFNPDLTGCVPGPNEDLPDDMFNDSNCDGVDGDITKAVFAAPDGDDNNLGTPESPVKTIGKAIALVNAANQAAGQVVKHSVYLSKDLGTGGAAYNESVTLKQSLNIYGGFDRNANWKRAATNTTTISGGPVAVVGSGINAETKVDLVAIKSANGSSSGQSSYGLFVTNSTGPLIVSNSTIDAGSGAPGANGANGSGGAAGGNGARGQDGCDGCQSNTTGAGGAGGTSSCSRGGGGGGNGGYNSDGGKGGDATSFPGSGQNGGGKSSVCFSKAGSGVRGLDGGGGSNGSTGGAAATLGSATIGGYQKADGGGGTSGTAGLGGGGGGGGGAGEDTLVCNDDEGAGGGGGGGAGCGASGGGGGGGGGASVGVFAYVSTINLMKTSVSSARGGNGGSGGNGASGGAGSSGGQAGVGKDDGGNGGGGGNGGAGGNSGAGSGGSGGPSFGIWMIGGAQVTYDQALVSVNGSAGLGGAAGTGPLGMAFAGQNSISGKVQTN